MSNLDGVKHYTKEELIEKGYTIDIPISGNPTLSLDNYVTTLIITKLKKPKLKEREVISDIALKKKGIDNYVVAKFIYHNPKKSESSQESGLYLIDYGKGKTEILHFSKIEKLLTKSQANLPLIDTWKKLSNLNKIF